MSSTSNAAGSVETGRAPGIAWPLAVALIVATILRVLLVLMPPEELSPGGIVPAEELRRGVAAHDIARGSLLPLLDYQQTHFSGGTLAIVLVATPIYAVFGPSPIALRAATLPFTWMTIALVVLILHRAAGRRAAWIGGLLAAAASPGYQLIAATAWGTHVESNAFALCVVWACARHLSGDVPPRRSSFVLGLASGLALSFSYGTALAIVATGLVELTSKPRPRFELLARVAGLAIGLVPWLAYNVTHEFAGLGLYGRATEEHFAPLTEAPAHFLALFARHLPASLAFPEAFGAPALKAIVALVFVVGWIATLVLVRAPRSATDTRGRRAVTYAVIVFPALFALAYAFGNFHVQESADWIHGYRYLALVWPFLWIATALTLDELATRDRTALAWGACGVLVALASAGTIARVRPDRCAANLAAPGSSTVSLARFVVRRRGADVEALERVVARAERREDAEVFFRALGANYRFLLDPSSASRPEDVARRAEYERARAWLEARVEPRWKPYFEVSMALHPADSVSPR